MVEDWAHAVGDVFLVGAVDGYAFFAVSVVAAGFLAGAVCSADC